MARFNSLDACPIFFPRQRNSAHHCQAIDRMESAMTLPLAGLRILAVEQFGAGPFGSMHLADLGAEVIKIEQPAGEGELPGDIARHTGGHGLGANDSQYFQTFNRNKRSITLDVKHARGRAVLHKLVTRADAVLDNLRGDLPAKLGLDYATLGRVKPAIVCVHISGYGRAGERAAWPAYDYLAQAEAGWTAMNGEPNGPPQRVGLSVVDFLAGLTAATGLLAAIIGARTTGKGRDVDVSLADVALHAVTYPATWYLNSGTEGVCRPRGGHPSIVPCEMFPTADGHVFIMCVKPVFWERLCDLTGLTQLPADPRFRSPKDRLANRDALVALLDPVMRARTSAEWMTLLGGRVPVAPVLSLGAALDQARSRGAVQTVSHPQAPELRLVANPILLDGTRLPMIAGPALGADVDAVLAEADCSPEEIAELKAAGAV
jgi:crotonobetainyl-CoA:carnitine CoA-transferase CaiB-like acyl-CoA transferase